VRACGERQRGREAERQRGREAERQRGREAERQRGRRRNAGEKEASALVVAGAQMGKYIHVLTC
jgi:hypothetical protein